MIKLQFFSTVDPVPATLGSSSEEDLKEKDAAAGGGGGAAAAAGAAGEGGVSGAFDYTGCPRYQTAVWESQLNWLRGGAPEQQPCHPSDDIEALLSALLEAPAPGTDYRREEPQRIGAAYALAPHLARQQDSNSSTAAAAAAALERVATGLRDSSSAEYVKRACMFCLGASGQVAVPALLDIMATADLDIATFAVHALADAARAPSEEVVAGVRRLISRAERAIDERTMAMESKWSGVSDPHAATGAGNAFFGAILIKRTISKPRQAQDKRSKTLRKKAFSAGIDQVMTAMLKCRAVCVQSLAPLAQHAVALGLAEVAASIATIVLDIISTPEPAQEAPTCESASAISPAAS